MPRFALPLLFSLVLSCSFLAAVAGYLIRANASHRAVLAIVTIVAPPVFIVSMNLGLQAMEFINRRR